MNAQEFSGWVDQCDIDGISGWAANSASAGVPVNVSLYINGVKVAKATCDAGRPDAEAAGFPGARQFILHPKPFLKQGKNVIEIAFEDTSRVINNGQHDIVLNDAAKIGDYWNERFSQKSQLTLRWWESDYIIRHINRRVCGESVPGASSGLHVLVRKKFHDRLPFARGISVGCGTGARERKLIEEGFVDHFTLYELSSVGVDIGRKEASEAGLADRMTFHLADAFERETQPEIYDFVYWNNALHHMFDVGAALEWTWRVLKKGGVLVMDEFVGPTRMQFSDRLLDINTEIRSKLPLAYLVFPNDPNFQCARVMKRPDLDVMIKIDPSECADSERILPELLRIFPDAWIQKTGGGVYHFALNDVMHNIIAAQDFALLDRLLEIDDQCADMGETHYAVAIAVK